jgi:hypothetical protein
LGRLKNFQSWSFAAVSTIIAVVIAVEFLDRPIAWVTYPVFGDLFFVRAFAGAPSLFGPLEILILMIFAFRRIAFYPLAYPDAVLVLCEASLLATRLLLSPLKFAFGRTWPLHGHPSFLIDGFTDSTSSLRVDNSNPSPPGTQPRSLPSLPFCGRPTQGSGGSMGWESLQWR